MRRLAATMLWVMAWAVVGCGSSPQRMAGNRPPRAVDLVDRITMLSLPGAINLDSQPGPDGLRVRVLMFERSQPQPVTAAGQLEYLMFDGRIGPSEFHTREPLQVWRFPAEELPRHLTRSMVGWGYSMELRWSGRTPPGNVVSLAARYVPPNGGPEAYSSPLIISLGRR